MQRVAPAKRCFAEPGPHQALTLVTAPALQRTAPQVLRAALRPGKAPGYPFSVSKNRTGSPVDGVTSSPCHITRRPRTNVPTGQPVTFTPS
jgi:hypothetical protein